VLNNLQELILSNAFLRLKPCPHSRRKVRLSQKTARQRRQSPSPPNSATVAEFGDCRTFLRECGQALKCAEDVTILVAGAADKNPTLSIQCVFLDCGILQPTY